MTIKTISENPLTVTLDGIVQTVLTHSYVLDGNNYEAKYIIASGEKILIQHRYDFNVGMLP